MTETDWDSSMRFSNKIEYLTISKTVFIATQVWEATIMLTKLMEEKIGITTIIKEEVPRKLVQLNNLRLKSIMIVITLTMDR
jgi:hypothetical protein